MFKHLLLATCLFSSTFAADGEYIDPNSIEEISKTTTAIGLVGNLSSSSENIVGCTFFKSVEILRHSKPYRLMFEFTRLLNMNDPENQFHYSTTISTPYGIIKRNSDKGARIDKVGTPMTITFNQQGELNKFDYGIDTESDSAPNLYVEFPDTNTHMQIRLILGYKCSQTRAPYGLTTDNTQEEGKLSAYDGPSVIFKEFSKIRTTVVFSATHMVSHQ